MELSWIEAGVLAASSIPVSEADIRSLHNQGIRAIVSLIEYPLTNFSELPTSLFEALNITYYHSPIPDQHAPELTQAQDIVRFIQTMREQQRPVLVHCHAGIGRTGTILRAYYLTQGYRLEEAAHLVRQRRPQCILLSEEQTEFLRRFVITTGSLR